MKLALDLASSTPQYEQIRQQIAALAASGQLRVGDRLPTVRALAADLGIASGTVARAYRDLESGGIVATRRRVGTVVLSAREPGETRAAAKALVATARREGLEAGEVLDIVRSEWLPGPTSSDSTPSILPSSASATPFG